MGRNRDIRNERLTTHLVAQGPQTGALHFGSAIPNVALTRHSFATESASKWKWTE
jgi:hypothetical protein